jgi:Ca2+-transporting ATPase
MLQLLLAAGTIYLIIGDPAEALILLGFAVLNVALVTVQESRTERALAALTDLTSPHALVIRDGARQRVSARELVAGDLVLVAEGDRVPADACLLEASNLEADESLLTGESVPVRKLARAVDDQNPAQPGGEDSAWIWSGSLIVAGTGLAEVTATGARTAIGRIGHTLGTLKSAPTPLQIQTRRLVWLFAVAGIGASVLLAVAYGVLHGDWVQAILAGITLAMATLPEEFPIVLTVFLILGAWRISRHRVLARRSAAIEALGAATVLCTDKTGTLTLNRMSVAKLKSSGAELDISVGQPAELPEEFHGLVEFAILASRPDPFDPMERAFHELGQRFLAHTEHLHSDWVLVHEYPLAPGLLAMSQAWQARAGDRFVIAAKGAPEALVDLCHLPPERLETIRRDVAGLAVEGLRVLAVAKGSFQGPDWPETQHDFTLAFIGLVGLADPLRPGVTDAIAACKAAGIRVAMITGDHPATARAIARQAGISADDVLTGAEMAEMDDGRLADRLQRTSVFARIMPEQKLRLVQAYAADDQVVAMTGDGVNDAPSLKAAHIGVAMGGHGTDVAREAASLVLLDDDFTGLVTAVRLGRRIDDNLRKAISYILAVHVPIAGMSLVPVLLGWPLLLGPIHVVFLELIIDPVSSIIFEAEPEEENLMARPPRDPDAPLFGPALMARGFAQGAVVLLAALAIFLIGVSHAHGEKAARAMAFMTLVLGNLGLILTNRSIASGALRTMLQPNRALGIVFALTLMCLVLALEVPWLRDLFGFARVGLNQILEATGAAIASVLINQLAGVVVRRLQSTATPVRRAYPPS